tara:strand:+ start:4057 stop:4674 length:618 start_codon:yes stop_codon:yes gene_type:complete
MNRLPDITMPPQEEMPTNEIKAISSLEEDLKIIGEGEILKEDLKADPFIRAEPIKPEQPQPRKKKAASEKQKTHLANARKLAKERKEQLKKEKEEEKKAKQKEKQELESIKEEPILIEEEDKEENAYIDWLNKMDKYNAMMALYKKQEEEKKAKELQKEKELEQKYFKKFHDQQKQLRKLEQPPKEQINNILEEQETFGKYSNYF